MAQYALVKSGVVVNLVSASVEFVNQEIFFGRIDAAAEITEEVDPKPAIGDLYNGAIFSTPPIYSKIPQTKRVFSRPKLFY